SQALIKEAKEKAEIQNLNIEFIVADMCREFPYSSAFFDRVLCFWNSFCHVVTEVDQINCLNEIYRVLKSNGVAIFLISNDKSEFWQNKLANTKDRIVDLDIVEGNSIPVFVHNSETLTQLIAKTSFSQFDIQFLQAGAKEWLILTMKKS